MFAVSYTERLPGWFLLSKGKKVLRLVSEVRQILETTEVLFVRARVLLGESSLHFEMLVDCIAQLAYP